MQQAQKLEALIGDLTGSRVDKREYTAEDITAFRMRREQKIQAEIERMNAEYSLRIIANSGLEHAIKSLKFSNFKAETDWQKDMKEIALDYARQHEGWLLLSGQSGSGKTHLCTAVAGHFLRHNLPVRYMRWRLDAGRLKPNYSNPDSADDELKKYINTPCLYLDDLFKGKITDSDIKLAYALIDGRYSANRKTIISTELTPEELLNIDEAIGGRILEKSKEHMFVVSRDREKNYRLVK